MFKFLNEISVVSGYENTKHLVESAFHPDSINFSLLASGVFGCLAYIFETIFGVVLPVGMVIVVLFLLELYTGIKASKLEGVPFSSKKFGKAWVKMLIYMIMIACSHILSTNMEVKPFFGLEFNVYEWLHYGFLNFVILQLIFSNLENFVRLGWTEYLPVLKKLAKFLNLKTIEKKEEEKDGE